MGICDERLVPFTKESVQDRDLVIKMLQWEERFIRDDTKGQLLYKNEFYRPLRSLDVEKTAQRYTLTHFGFESTDEDLKNYRSIFKHYFQSPHDYDKEVINAAHYMRENRCIYYDQPIVEVGSKIPDVDGLESVGNVGKCSTLHQILEQKPFQHCFVAAFSLS